MFILQLNKPLVPFTYLTLTQLDIIKIILFENVESIQSFNMIILHFTAEYIAFRNVETTSLQIAIKPKL